MASLMEIRRRILQNADNLPPAYKRTGHIIGVGYGSIIDTGVNGNNDNLRFAFCIEINEVRGYAGFFGNYIDEQTDCWRLITQAASATGGFYITRNRKAGSSTGLYATNPSNYTNRKIYVDASRDGASLKTDTSTYELRADTKEHGTENNTNVAIGYSKITTGSTNTLRTKWYYFKVYDNGKLIRNYIPCYRKSDNIAGFYDTANDTFNPSIGINQFLLPEGN